MTIQARKGFTLVELLISIGVIGVLSGIVVTSISPARQLTSANDAQRQVAEREIENALTQYIIDHGSIPGGQELSADENQAIPICRKGEYDASCVNLDTLVTESYVAALPLDIAETNNLLSGYTVFMNGPRVEVVSQFIGQSGSSAAASLFASAGLGGSGEDTSNSVLALPDGGYIVGGYSYSSDGDVGDNNGNADFWVVRLNANGTIAWEKNLGGTGAEQATSMAQADDGGFVIAGVAHQANGDVSAIYGSFDFWIVKLTAAGDIAWDQNYGGTGFDILAAITPTSDGGFVLVGSTGSNNVDVEDNNGNFDYWVLKINSNGVIEWEENLGGTSADQALGVVQASDGGFVIVGSSESNDVDVGANNGQTDFWIVKLTGLGILQWQNNFGGTTNDVARSVVATTDGGFVIAGSTDSQDGDVGSTNGGTDYWVIKISAAGTLVWEKNFGDTGSDEAYAIIPSGDGFAVAGNNADPFPGDVIRGHDYWTLRLNSLGDIIWESKAGGTNTDDAMALAATTDGGFVVAGQSLSDDGDVNGNNGQFDYWVVKLTSSGQIDD